MFKKVLVALILVLLISSTSYAFQSEEIKYDNFLEYSIHYISMFGGGYGGNHIDHELIRYSIGFALWFMLFRFALFRQRKKVSEDHESLIMFGSLIGMISELFMLFVYSYLVYYGINFTGDLYNLVCPINYTLTLISTSSIAIAFTLYLKKINYESARLYIIIVIVISLSLFLLNYSHIIFTILNSLVLIYPIYHIAKSKVGWIKHPIGVAVSIFLLNEIIKTIIMLPPFLDGGNILACYSSNIYITPFLNNAHNFAIGVFIYVYIKDIAIQLEEQRNESDTKADNNQIIIQGVAHELRSPLAGLLGLIELHKEQFSRLINSSEPNEDCSSCMKSELLNNIIEDGYEQIDGIVKNLNNMVINLSTFGKKTRQVDIKVNNLKPLLKTSVKFAKFAEESKLVTSDGIKLIGCNDVKEAKAMVSPSKFLQIIQNLILNSIKAVHQKGEILNPSIEIELSENDNNYIIEVLDNGIGMDSNELKRCTEKYYTTRENAGGTGLGLHFVKKYMEEINGSIEIDSIKHEWTKVKLIIPKYND